MATRLRSSCCRMWASAAAASAPEPPVPTTCSACTACAAGQGQRARLCVELSHRLSRLASQRKTACCAAQRTGHAVHSQLCGSGPPCALLSSLPSAGPARASDSCNAPTARAVLPPGLGSSSHTPAPRVGELSGMIGPAQLQGSHQAVHGVWAALHGRALHASQAHAMRGHCIAWSQAGRAGPTHQELCCSRTALDGPGAAQQTLVQRWRVVQEGRCAHRGHVQVQLLWQPT